MSRTTISIRDDVFERLEADKGDNESWSGYLERLADGERVPRPQDGNGECMNALTEAHIDDIGADVERRVERLLDDRLTRR